jgi:hypothetical protein
MTIEMVTETKAAVKLVAGDTIKVDGKVYRVYDDGQRLRLWLISHPSVSQADYDQTVEATAGRLGY